MAVVHVVLARAESGREGEVTDVLSALARFAESAPRTRAVSGADVSREGFQQGYTHGLVISFADDNGRAAYLGHPRHQELADVLVSVTEVCLVVALPGNAFAVAGDEEVSAP